MLRRFLSVLILAAALAIGYMAGQVSAKQPHMKAALQHLQAARSQLQQATHDKGGHRAKALELTQNAINEVQAGIQAGKN